MKEIKHFHIEQIERGDKLHLSANPNNRSHRDWKGPLEFDITVLRTHKTSTFGWLIFSEETIGPEEENQFYTQDDWTVTHDGPTMMQPSR